MHPQEFQTSLVGKKRRNRRKKSKGRKRKEKDRKKKSKGRKKKKKKIERREKGKERNIPGERSELLPSRRGLPTEESRWSAFFFFVSQHPN
jgi:hypothetical protein